MKELGSFNKICIALFILLTVSYSADIKPSESEKLNNIVSYINETFEFSSQEDKNTFQLNQKKWLESAKNDCYIAYSDIGSRSSFLLYYNACLHDIQDKRILTLLNLYMCKSSTMSGEKCQLPAKIFEEVMLLVNKKTWYPKITVVIPVAPNTPLKSCAQSPQPNQR